MDGGGWVGLHVVFSSFVVCIYCMYVMSFIVFAKFLINSICIKGVSAPKMVMGYKPKGTPWKCTHIVSYQL